MAFDQETEESWETTTGLVENFTGTVTDALFTFDNTYQDGEAALLKLVVKADDPDLFPPDEDGEGGGETTLIYTAGKGFEPADKGARIQHESGKPKKFNKTSGVGLLVDSALELKGVANVLKERGKATDAGVWVGLNFDFENKEFEATRKGETIKWSRMLPVKFNGEGEQVEVKKAPAKKAAAKKETAAEEPAAATDTDAPAHDLPAPLRGKLKAVAVSADDHDAFMEAAYSTLDLDAAAEAAVQDEGFYVSLKAG